jgi:histidyl-tRNA synthetase
VETPAIEYTDALGKFLPDQDRPNEGVFSFQDDDEQWLSLRYDLTAPLARYVAEHFDALPKPYRSYRVGWVFRNEKPGPGRFRQFMQFDADTVGSASPAADAEICMMAADTMEELGLSGQYVIKINNRKILDGLLEAVELGGEANAGRRLGVLRAIDKYDRLERRGVEQLLGKGRKDDSGDFTPGAGLDPQQITRVLDYVEFQLDEKTGDLESVFEDWRCVVGANRICDEGINELSAMAALCRSAGYGADRIRFDSSVVRGLEYYTGPVFEADLTFEIRDEDGRAVRFGSVAAGGRYDGLVGRFRNDNVPATGFSIGVSRLQAALTMLGKLDSGKEFGPVVVTVFGGDIADYQKMVASLRRAGIRAELYLGNPKHSLGQQMKYADRRNSPCAIVQGSDEKARGKVQIKDLISGAGLTDIKDREEYLKRQAEAQTEVDQAQLVEAVRKILARHEVRWG